MIDWIYSLYERRLRRQLRKSHLPSHIGIILDGNRRYAQKKGINDPCLTYKLGAQKLDDVLCWCSELDIQAVTLWVCSIDNLKRPSAEITAIFEAVESKIITLLQSPLVERLDIHLRAAGRLDLLPASTIAVIRQAEAATINHKTLTITFALAYGGREEIADAVRDLLIEQVALGKSPAEIAAIISPEAIDRHLYTVALPDPDLIIRTSGEFRLSGFLLWQSATSELYFTDVNWPGFRKIDFYRAIRSYQERHRRFGR